MERFETKYDLLNRVYADTRLKRTTKSLMQYLVAKSDDKSCHPSVATIAAAIRMSERTVQRHMRELERYNYLVCRKRFYRNEQLTNQYEFVLDVVDDSDLTIKNKRIGSGMNKLDMQKSNNDNVSFNKMKYIKKIAKTGLSNKECLVLIYFVHKANRNGIAYGQLKAVSRELHISVRLLWKIILELRAEQYLLLKNCKGTVFAKLLERDVTQEGIKTEKGELYPESGDIGCEYKSDRKEDRNRTFKMSISDKIRIKLLRYLRAGYACIKKKTRHFLS